MTKTNKFAKGKKAPVSKPKIDLAKEAKTTAKVEIEGEITDSILFEFCPKQFLPEFKKAKTPAARADLLYAVDKARLAITKEAKLLDEFEGKLKRWFVQNLPEKDATGITGKVARVQLNKKDVPAVKDWPKFYAFIKKNNAFEMLNRAVNAKSVAERWEAGKQVPGVEKFTTKTVSLTKK